MDLLEFFDVYNMKHLQAYNYLTENVVWPERFIPENCILSSIWQYQLAEKMAVIFVNLAVAGQIPNLFKPSSTMTRDEEDEILMRGYF